MSAYPIIADRDHPLWEAQQAGWPDHAPHEAMSEAVRLAPPTRGDSADHPAYDRAAIRNPLAERPPAPYWLDKAVPKDRR